MFNTLGRILTRSAQDIAPVQVRDAVRPVLHGRTVLVVEDDPGILALLHQRLVALGASVYTATNGESALREFHAVQPDLALVDVMLPVVSGFELGRRFRAMATRKPVGLVAMSARNLPQDVAHARECGFDDYVTKPFRLGELCERLGQVMQARA